MLLRQIFDPQLAQYAYLIGCQQTGEALIIDPERDVDRYIRLAQQEGLRITAVAETHIHADFLSGGRELAEGHGAHLYVSDEGGPDWRYEWVLEAAAEKGSDLPYEVTFLKDGDRFWIGKIEITAVHTPGHTPEHLSFLVTDHGGGATQPMGIATGDFVFVGDLGRPDLLESAAGIAGQQEPSARKLYASVGRFLDLPDFLQVWPAHGAGSACGKALGAVPTSTVGYERRHNAAIDATRRGEDAFVDSILDGQPEPPLYFATMKKLNKEGAAVLGGLPHPTLLQASEVKAALDAPRGDAAGGKGGTVVIDTRLDRDAFMVGHLKGSLFAPLNNSFPTVVGSFVRPEQRIILVADEDDVDSAVRSLIRIGFDRVVGYVPPEVLHDEALEDRLVSTPKADFSEVPDDPRDGATVLDVRGASEYRAGHLVGALNVAHTRLLDRLDEVPEDGRIYVHCRRGARAAVSSALLEREGRDVVWVDDDFPAGSDRVVRGSENRGRENRGGEERRAEPAVAGASS